jgi:hypothetical protein
MGVDATSYGTPRADLGEAMREYIKDQNEYIATKLFPLTPVDKQGANFAAVTRKSAMASVDTKRAAGSNYNRTNFGTEDKAYACEEHGLEGQLDAGDRAKYASDLDAEVETVNDVTGKLLRAQEIRVAANVSESVFDSAAVFTHCSAVWTTATNQNIIKDVQAARLKGYNLCGMRLNTLTVSETTLNRIMINAEIKDAIKYVQGAEWDVIKGALARILGVEQILVGNGIYDSKPEGATVATPATIWPDKYALLSVTPADGKIVKPSLGRTMLWVNDTPENVMVETYEEPQTRSTIYRVRQFVDEVLIDKYFGQLIDVEAAS